MSVRRSTWGFSCAQSRGLAVFSLLLLQLSSACAHRLDECLQAARISVSREKIEVELDLTPGVDTLTRILPLIDLDLDGSISAAEGEAYADLVRTGLILEVDGRSQTLRLIENQFPSLQEMKNGMGTIRLKLSVAHLPLRPGRHHLRFSNHHQIDLSVYLANVLVPSDTFVEIKRQTRDTLQRELSVDFRVKRRIKGL